MDQDTDTITVSWAPPSPPPTGYVIYWQAPTEMPDSGSMAVTDGSTDQFDITDRNRDSYDITIVATSSNHLPSTVVGPVSTTCEWIYTYIRSTCFKGSNTVFMGFTL